MSARLQIETADGIRLETRIDTPEEPVRVAVLCHPHPLQGGTMNAPLMIAVTRRLVARGHTVIRFNFRGSGASTGSHDFGEAELGDVTAVAAHARGLNLPLGIGGWSFGAGVALNWLAEAGEIIPYAGVAPDAKHLPVELPAGPKRIILGTRDQVVDPEALQRYTIDQGIDLVLTPGDHFFHGRGDRIGDLVAQGLEM